MSKIQAWHEINTEQVFKKYSRKIDKVTFKLPDDTLSDFYIKVEGPTAAVVALTENNEVVLVRQYRPGPRKILMEIPGGFIDPGEDALEAASREFLEETGYIGDFEKVGACFDDAYSSMERHCFIAKNCKKVAEPQHTSTETTEVVLMSVLDFRNHLRSGQLTDVEIGYLSLDHLGML